MSYDVVVVGPPSLDLRFRGAPHLPAIGEEVHCSGLEIGAGGAAISAITAARLGFSAAVAWPVGTDRSGALLTGALADDGVDWIGPECEHTWVTAVVAVAGDRAMITHAPTGAPARPPDARAQIVRLGDAANGSAQRRYVVTDDPHARQGGTGPPPVPDCEALLLNEREARHLTGCADPLAGARLLMDRTGARTVVVTLGALGAVAATREPVGEARVAAFPTQVVDTTGAGDVFSGAYVCADMLGWPLDRRLTLGCLAASLSVQSASGIPAAPTRAALRQAAARHGMSIAEQL